MTRDDFLNLVDNELGLRYRTQDMEKDFDQLSSWDSVHVVRLISALEAATESSLPAAAVFEARTLERVYELATAVDAVDV